MSKQIKSNHYYVLKTHPGISGFVRWDEWVETIVTGYKARQHRLEIDREYLARGLGHFRLADGHLSDRQPVVSEVEALRWLDVNPYRGITKVS